MKALDLQLNRPFIGSRAMTVEGASRSTVDDKATNYLQKLTAEHKVKECSVFVGLCSKSV